MQENTNWYWKQQPLQQTIMVPICTILHPRIDAITMRYVEDIHKIICNRIQGKQSIQIYPLSKNIADYDYILNEIERLEKQQFEWNVSVNSD